MSPEIRSEPSDEFAESDRPAAAECFAASLRGARQAWSPRFFFPPALIALYAWLVRESLVPPEAGGTSGFATGAAWTSFGVLAWLAGSLIALLAAWEFGRGEALGLFEGVRLLLRRWRAVIGAPIFVALSVSVPFGLALGGASLLRTIPAVGGPLAWIWTILPGLPLNLLAAGFLLLGLPAMPLILVAGAVELPYPFDAVGRGMSYVRGHPSLYLVSVAGGLLGAAFGAACFAFLLAALVSMVGLAMGYGLEPLRRGAGALDGSGGTLVLVAGFLLAGYAAAAIIASLARAYLLLRWKVDGEPPGSLVNPGEQFQWQEASQGKAQGNGA